MDTMTMNGEDVRHELQELEKAQAASSHAGWGASHPSGDASRGDGDHGGHAGRHRRGRGGGGIGLVVGMFLSLAIVHTTRTHY